MDKRKPKFNGASPLSWILFSNLRSIYYSELDKGLDKKASRNKYHIHTTQGVTGFLLAVSVWESFLNEVFFSDLVSHCYSNNLLLEIKNEAERWDLKTKTLMYPKFFFGKTFENNSHSLGDFLTIVQIRNNITHYKHSLYEGPEKALKNLRNKNISYPKPDNVGCPWHMELSSTECIRFCINTITDLIKDLESFQTEYYRSQCMPIMTQVFNGIKEHDLDKIFEQYNIDPKTTHKALFGIENN